MIRKKYLLSVLCFAFLALSNVVSSNPVSKNVAQTVASNFYSFINPSVSARLNLSYQENSTDGLPLYYVFNMNHNHGFVIVSGEDAVHPILGYAIKGQFVLPSDNSNVGWWMNCRKQEISYARNESIVASSDINNEWSSYINNTPSRVHSVMSNVNPLIQTTWNQSPYYNATCPGGSVTGCVATTMAQLMRYWNYPTHGHGSSFYWDEQVFGYSDSWGYLGYNYDTANYIWASMPLNLSSNNSQVARLMLNCGISVNMDYTGSESGAWVITGDFPSCAQNSLVQYFGYNRKTIQGLYQKNFTNSAWLALLQNELNNSRPVEYVGWDSITNGGHTWVCDGYDITGLNFDMNWGWGGADDGYYALNALNTGPGDWNWWNEALIGIEPPPVSAYFEASPTMGCSGMSVQFTDWSISDSNNPITTYNWIFPGGSPGISPNPNPLITYTAAGTYDVTEIVSNAYGSDTMIRKAYISVAENSSLPLSEGFQSSTFPPIGGWVINNPNNYLYTWQLDTNLGGYGASTHCMYFNNAQEGNDWLTPPIKAGNDIIGQKVQMFTPEYDFTSVSNPKIYFDVAYEPYSVNYSDTLDIYYSTDCGVTFHSIYSKGGGTLGTTGHSVKSGGDTNSEGIFVPQNNEWRTDTIHVAAIAGMNNVMFSFENRSGNGSPVYIDNINIPGLLTATNVVSHPAPSVNVYPNPSNGAYSIALQNVTGNPYIVVYNVLGQQVYSNMLKTNINSINLNSQPKGVYIYRIFFDNGGIILTGRLVVE